MKHTKITIRLLTQTVLLVVTMPIIPLLSAEDKQNSDWEVSLGLGLAYAPEYEGSDDSETEALPYFEAIWRETFFLNVDELGVNLYQGDSASLSAAVGIEEGRDEDDSDNLRGLGDIDRSATLTLSTEFDLGLVVPNISVTSHNGGTDGVQAVIGVETIIPLAVLTGSMDSDNLEYAGFNDGPVFTLGLSADWADEDYNGGFFGVTAAQSTHSGLPRYTVGAGFKSLNLELNFLYPIDESWSINGIVSYTKLIGDVADSPIVKDVDQVFVGSFLAYYF